MQGFAAKSVRGGDDVFSAHGMSGGNAQNVVRRTQRSRSEATRSALIAVARSMFGSRGYMETNTVDLVASASLTRGALYHHFSGKEDLFAAVALEVAIEISQDASQAALALPGDTWTRFLTGQRLYLELIANRPEAQRILLIDGPAILGWERWRGIQSDVVLPGTIYGISKLVAEGFIRTGEPEILAHLILAALNDAAMAVANAPDPKVARNPITDALLQLLEGLYRRP